MNIYSVLLLFQDEQKRLTQIWVPFFMSYAGWIGVRSGEGREAELLLPSPIFISLKSAKIMR